MKTNKSQAAFLGLVLILVLGAFVVVYKHNYKSSDKVTDQPKVVASTEKAQKTEPGANNILDLSGTGSKQSTPFEVESPWAMGYKYDCSKAGGTGVFQVFVYNTNATLAVENPPVNLMGATGHDITSYYKGGSFYLSVNSTCEWSLSVL